MAETTVVLVNKLGLHARAAAKIVNLAKESDSVIQIERPNQNLTADARSILGLLELAAKEGSTIVIRAEGPDEEDAICKLSNLINNGFGEL